MNLSFCVSYLMLGLVEGSLLGSSEGSLLGKTDWWSPPPQTQQARYAVLWLCSILPNLSHIFSASPSKAEHPSFVPVPSSNTSKYHSGSSLQLDGSLEGTEVGYACIVGWDVEGALDWWSPPPQTQQAWETCTGKYYGERRLKNK